MKRDESIEEYQKRGDQFLSEFDKWYKTPFIKLAGPITQAEREQNIRAAILSGGVYIEEIGEDDPQDPE